MGFFSVPLETTIVKCPECIKNGQTSVVTLLNCKRGMVMEFWDQKGRYHKHYLEPCSVTFKCSLNHEFRTEENVVCWCGTTMLGLAEALKLFGVSELPASYMELLELRAKKVEQNFDINVTDICFKLISNELDKKGIL